MRERLIIKRDRNSVCLLGNFTLRYEHGCLNETFSIYVLSVRIVTWMQCVASLKTLRLLHCNKGRRFTWNMCPFRDLARVHVSKQSCSSYNGNSTKVLIESRNAWTWQKATICCLSQCLLCDSFPSTTPLSQAAYFYRTHFDLSGITKWHEYSSLYALPLHLRSPDTI